MVLAEVTCARRRRWFTASRRPTPGRPSPAAQSSSRTRTCSSTRPSASATPAVAAGFRIGEMYRDLFRAIVDAPVPGTGFHGSRGPSRAAAPVCPPKSCCSRARCGAGGDAHHGPPQRGSPATRSAAPTRPSRSWRSSLASRRAPPTPAPNAAPNATPAAAAPSNCALPPRTERRTPRRLKTRAEALDTARRAIHAGSLATGRCAGCDRDRP